MAATIRNGRASLLAAVHELDRVYRKYGAAPLVAYTGVTGFTATLSQLSTAYQQWRAGDDFPGEIDPTAPDGPEDE